MLKQLMLWLKQNEIRNNSTSAEEWCKTPDHRMMTLKTHTNKQLRIHTANEQVTCLYNEKARVKCHLAVSIAIIMNISVRNSYNSEDLAKSIPGEYCSNAHFLARWETKKFTMSVFHSKFLHDDRLLINRVQEQYYPYPNSMILHWQWIVAYWC